MNLRMTLAIPALLGMACLLGGCETECYKMTDGGSIGRDIDSWKLTDKQYSDELMPQLRQFWTKEKPKWPVFVKKCEDGGTCYDKSVSETVSAKKAGAETTAEAK